MGFWSKTDPKNQQVVRPGREGDQLRVQQLELQLKELATTAAQAVDRAESLEGQLQQLRSERDELKQQQQSQQQKQRHASVSSTSSTEHNSLYSAPSRSSSFTTVNTSASPRSLNSSNSNEDAFDLTDLRKRIRELQSTNEELTLKLQSEQQLRRDCESREQALTGQIEDLSSSLFEEANRKVAIEKQKCDAYEKKLKRIDAKDAERDQRWHNIEVAISAIHKARTTLNSAPLHRCI